MVKTTKGGRVMNPADAFRKEQRKKEIARNKAERKFIRDAGKKKEAPKELRDELKELIELEQSGVVLSKLQKIRKKVLQEAYDAALKRQMEDEYRKKRETELVAEGAAAPERPEDSRYYHPLLNPTGAPPPGKLPAGFVSGPAGIGNVPLPKPPPLPAGPKPGDLPAPPAAPPLPPGPGPASVAQPPPGIAPLPPPPGPPPGIIPGVPPLPPPPGPPPGAARLPPPLGPPLGAGHLPPPQGPPPGARLAPPANPPPSAAAARGADGAAGVGPGSAGMLPPPPGPPPGVLLPPPRGPPPGNITSAPPTGPPPGAGGGAGGGAGSAAAAAAPAAKQKDARPVITGESTVARRLPAHQDKAVTSMVPASVMVRRPADKAKRPLTKEAIIGPGFGLAPVQRAPVAPAPPTVNRLISRPALAPPAPAALAPATSGAAGTSGGDTMAEFMRSMQELGAFD